MKFQAWSIVTFSSFLALALASSQMALAQNPKSDHGTVAEEESIGEQPTDVMGKVLSKDVKKSSSKDDTAQQQAKSQISSVTPKYPSNENTAVGTEKEATAAANAIVSALVSSRWDGCDYDYYSDSYSPFNYRIYSTVGIPGYGYSDYYTCLSAVSNAPAESVCNWNGYNYQPFSDTFVTTGVGKTGYGYSSVYDCTSATKNSSQGVVCNWNGSNYQPYVAANNRKVGKTDYGFSTLASCRQTTYNSRRNGAVCNWNGYNYQPHSARGGYQVGIKDYGFSKLSDCQYAAKNSASKYVCNWNGYGYAAYYVPNYIAPQVSVTYSTLSQCVSIWY